MLLEQTPMHTLRLNQLGTLKQSIPRLLISEYNGSLIWRIEDPLNFI